MSQDNLDDENITDDIIFEENDNIDFDPLIKVFNLHLLFEYLNIQTANNLFYKNYKWKFSIVCKYTKITFTHIIFRKENPKWKKISRVQKRPRWIKTKDHMLPKKLLLIKEVND